MNRKGVRQPSATTTNEALSFDVQGNNHKRHGDTKNSILEESTSLPDIESSWLRQFLKGISAESNWMESFQ